LLGDERWPQVVEDVIGRGLRERLVSDEHPKPERAVQHVDHGFDVKGGTRSRLCGLESS
jgi:hypothetical protein